MSRVLVTGGLGVVGAWVTRALLEAGQEVVTLDPREDLALVDDIAGDFARRTQSVTELDELARVLQAERIDAIAHCAVFDAPGRDPYAAFDVNARGTLTLLEAAHRADVRRVAYTSSKAVLAPFTGAYGHPIYAPVPPDAPRRVLPQLAVYTASKRFSEDVGEVYAERFGIEFAALRFATIVGPGKQARHGPTSVHSRIIENAMAGEGTDIERGADQRDDMVYVKDVAQGVVRATLAEGPLRRAYNIGSGRLCTLGDFADAVRRHVAEVPITIGPGLDYVALLDTSCLMDIEAAREDLGYEPAYDLDAMVLDYVATQRRLGLDAVADQRQSAWSEPA